MANGYEWGVFMYKGYKVKYYRKGVGPNGCGTWNYCITDMRNIDIYYCDTKENAKEYINILERNNG